MTRRFAVALLAGLTFGFGPVSVGPVQAEYCRPVMPDHAADVRGLTFEAAITGVRLEGRAPTLTYVTMTVRRVYADSVGEDLQVGQEIEIYSNPCDGFGLLGVDVGDRVLMSTAYLLYEGYGPATWNTALWRVNGANLDLAVLRGKGFGKVWFTDDRRIAKADTVQEALALVAPAAAGMPDTSTDPGRQDKDQNLWLIAAGLGVLLLAACSIVIPRRKYA